MPTFLELAQTTARESGSVDPAAITAVTGLTGRPAKIVNWVAQAYTNIQRSRRDWGWLNAEFSYALVPGTAVYTPASFSLTRFANWQPDTCHYSPVTLYDPTIGVADEGPLRQITYQQWQTLYGRGDQSNLMRPVDWAVSPANEIMFGPYPDKTYVVSGIYQKGPQTLTASTDVPEMPSQYHQMIVWEALRLSMIHDGSYQEGQFITMEMLGLRHELERDQLPEITI